MTQREVYRSECLQNGVKYLQRAVSRDNEKKYKDALDNYVSAVDWILLGLRYSREERSKQILRKKIAELLHRAEELKVFLNTKVPAPRNHKNHANNNAEQHQLTKDIEDTLLSEAKTAWNDVVGLQFAKKTLEESVLLPNKFPHMFKGKRKAWKGILLYGPPGTGKTHIAKALAGLSRAQFYAVSASDLVSKYVGDSEKHVAELFRHAFQNQPSIIFFDEIDSVCGKRKDNENDATRRIKTELLIRMQQLHDHDGVLMLAATNKPDDLDPAILRRFEKRLYIPLPDAKARAELFRLHLGNEPLRAEPNIWQTLASKTEGYSGSDIAAVVREALFIPLRQAMHATHWKSVFSNSKEMMTPAHPQDRGAKKIKMMDLEPETVLLPEISEETFLQAIATVKPSVAKEELDMFEQWTKMYGTSGNTPQPSWEDMFDDDAPLVAPFAPLPRVPDNPQFIGTHSNSSSTGTNQGQPHTFQRQPQVPQPHPFQRQPQVPFQRQPQVPFQRQPQVPQPHSFQRQPQVPQQRWVDVPADGPMWEGEAHTLVRKQRTPRGYSSSRYPFMTAM